VARGRTEQPDPAAARRLGPQPPLLPWPAGPGRLPGVRPAGRSRLVFFLGQGLLEVSGPAAVPPGHSVMIWIQVRDVHAEHARLAAAGVPVVRDPAAEPWGFDQDVDRGSSRRPDCLGRGSRRPPSPPWPALSVTAAGTTNHMPH